MSSTLSSLAGYKVLAQDGSLLRLQRDDGRQTVVSYSPTANQVYSVGSDNPSQGQWFAGATAKGIDYVATWRSPASARRAFKAELAR